MGNVPSIQQVQHQISNAQDNLIEWQDTLDELVNHQIDLSELRPLLEYVDRAIPTYENEADRLDDLISEGGYLNAENFEAMDDLVDQVNILIQIYEDIITVMAQIHNQCVQQIAQGQLAVTRPSTPQSDQEGSGMSLSKTRKKEEIELSKAQDDLDDSQIVLTALGNHHYTTIPELRNIIDRADIAIEYTNEQLNHILGILNSATHGLSQRAIESDYLTQHFSLISQRATIYNHLITVLNQILNIAQRQLNHLTHPTTKTRPSTPEL